MKGFRSDPNLSGGFARELVFNRTRSARITKVVRRSEGPNSLVAGVSTPESSKIQHALSKSNADQAAEMGAIFDTHLSCWSASLVAARLRSRARILSRSASSCSLASAASTSDSNSKASVVRSNSTASVLKFESAASVVNSE
jgi:hypothetical protein